MVLGQVLVDGGMGYGPCRLAECCQQQDKGHPAPPKTSHRERRYPFSLHAPERIGSRPLRLEGGEMPMYGLGLALLSALLFGASTPASKALLGSFEPFQLAGLLYLGAALGMAPAIALERRRGARMRLDRANRLRLGGAVLFGGILGPVLLLFGLRLVSAGGVSLLLNLEMVATAVLGVVLFREHLGRTGWLGVAGVGAAGVILSGAEGTSGMLGASCVAAACFCWGLDNHLTALIDGITPARSTLAKGLVAGTTSLVVGASLAPLSASPWAFAAGLGVGALSYGLSITLYIASAHELGATRAQGVFAAAPFLGAALSFALLGESFGPAQAAAAVLLAVSIAALLSSQHDHVHEHAELEHVHSHRHDDNHHLHEHPGLPLVSRHRHAHRHTRLVHAHPHWPDLHHRHDHVDVAEPVDDYSRNRRARSQATKRP